MSRSETKPPGAVSLPPSEYAELTMLRDALMAASHAVLMTDPNLPDNPIVYVNDGFERLTGYSKGEVLGRNCRFLHGDDHEQEGVRRLRAAVERCESVQVEVRNYRKDGTMFWNELHVTPVLSGSTVKYFLGVYKDVTRRKEAEAGQRLMTQVVDNANEVVVVTGPQLEPPGPQIIYVNRAFSEMTGFAPDEVIGKTPRMFQGPQTDRTVLGRMRRQLTKGRTFHGETVNYRRDGSTFILSWQVAPIRDAQGTITHWVSTQHDVTARRALERETLDISAREQQRIAGDLHDALQQHLVGTAMQAKALARTLARRGDDQAEEAERLYALVQEGVTGLRTVVQGIVPVQAHENGLMVALEGLTTKINHLYGVPCTFILERPILLKNFELATQLYYIAQEALTNAAKHAAARSVKLSLARTDGHVALTVRDDGRGFDGHRSGAHTGMGLRLMAYRARLAGIELDITSQPGRGTTVTCLFVPS